MKKNYNLSLEKKIVDKVVERIESTGGKLSPLVEYLLKKFLNEEE